MQHEDIIENVREELEKIKGVGETYVLDEEDRKMIEKLEEQASQMTLMGLGIGDNRGVKEVIKSDVIVAFTTTMEYEWPCGPNVILMHRNEVVGEEVNDPEELKKWDCKDNALVIGNIVIYGKDVLNSAMKDSERIVVVMPPKECPEISRIPDVKDVALGSPSPPSDEYIKEKMKVTKEQGMGTFMLGFNFK
ncbi:conserved hypothetical protein [Methanosalsum zhilinae DSM 4017]|uniref:Uncharacterized protein n=1 Tax=Methanosalsum zhilinae (strain DSM 4017 / NBRC 107636 / OCM 62 / WeN5) TaxID=679901 RepID=F7XPQ6_METZD|nr:hypothetical protein [Methanosalsum zhilinae]AEH60326.1 conserved hypothetical protein [Methanosalsum zhilinae DSM 4017]